MKKQLSMLLAAGMAVSMLAGCGGTSSTTTSSSGSTATGDTGSSAAAEGIFWRNHKGGTRIWHLKS